MVVILQSEAIKSGNAFDLGDIPKANDNIELKVDNINIEVVKVSNKKLETVRVRYIRKIN